MGPSSSSSCVCVGSQSDTQRNVSKEECYYRAKKKHFREDLILPELLADNLSDVPVDIFQWKRRFCKRNKNCAARKKYSERSSEEGDNNSITGQPHGLNMIKRRNWGLLLEIQGWNKFWPNKSVINNRTFSGDDFFEILCKQTNLYYFQNEGKYAIIFQYIFNFCLVPLHKGEFFQRCQSLKH
jgi:hypothetical protein